MSNHARPQNWKALALPIQNFAEQPSSLPRVPLPPLQATLQRLKDSLRPLARSTDEFVSTCNKIDDFGRPDGPGPILQQFLVDRRKEKDNWLEEWWDDSWYLACRDPIAVNVSPYVSFEPQPGYLPQGPAARAAALTYAIMVFRDRLLSGNLTPEASKDAQYCMDAYRWMFDCCRIPGTQGVDWSVSYSNSPNPGNDLGHVIVLRKNRFWKLKAQVGDKLVGMGDLIKQFQYIYDHATEEYPGIGGLTASHRDVWAKDYALLSSVPANAAIFREIHSSAFVMSLDDSTPIPENDVDVSRALWHGTIPSAANPTGISRGLNSRFFDKPIQIIVFDNSISGLVGEHSTLDGTHYFRLCNDLLAFIADPKSDFQLSPSSTFTPPEPLDFDLTSTAGIYDSISSSQKLAYDVAASKALSLTRTSYGKSTIKGFGVGPDGWAQMLVQLAYARLAARFGGENGPVVTWPVPTHEAAMLRRFYKGREETIRVVTDECVAFVRAMLGGIATREEKVQLLRRAVSKHQRLASEAGVGEGSERHLLGLRTARPASMPEPTLFSDPLLTRSGDGTLTTSALFSRHIAFYGWGELQPDGFGIAYMTGSDDYLQFTITSRCEMPNAEFANEISDAAEELYELFAGPPTQNTGNRVVVDVHARL